TLGNKTKTLETTGSEISSGRFASKLSTILTNSRAVATAALIRFGVSIWFIEEFLNWHATCSICTERTPWWISHETPSPRIRVAPGGWWNNPKGGHRQCKHR